MTAKNDVMNNKRAPQKRIFVNRPVDLSAVKYVGFDMDYTLALYKSPDFEQLVYDEVMNHLIESYGYPKEMKDLHPNYHDNFGVRGVWLDRDYGNLLKTDAYGNITLAFHGFRELTNEEILEYYPNKFVGFASDRIFVMSTLYHLPEIYAIACAISYFEKQRKSEKLTFEKFIRCKRKDTRVYYRDICSDIRQTIDYVHNAGIIKNFTVKNIEKFLGKEPILATYLSRLKESKRKIFLLTNSPYDYTDSIMSYLLNDNGNNWRNYFDYIVVDAMKPAFFEDSSLFREIHTGTKKLKIGLHEGPLIPGKVYSKGNVDTFMKCMGAEGKDVLYVGDHVFGDVLKSKKLHGWRTFLLVPELLKEIKNWQSNPSLYTEYDSLNESISNRFLNKDSSYIPSTIELDELKTMNERLRELLDEMENLYPKRMGSLLRTFNRPTHFASQMVRYADLYASTCFNLIFYPLHYPFRTTETISMPHESTIHH